MTAIATRTGRVIDFLNPDPAQFSLEDIQSGLASEQRFAGQIERPYSVLQHSLLVAFLVPPECRLQALMHDAPEAYLRDIPSPAKDAMRRISNPSPYDEIEWRLWAAICARWDIGSVLHPAVKLADLQAMAIEAPVLQPEGWKHSIWDFAREIEYPATAVRYFHALLMDGQSTAVGYWLEGVASELAKRRRAA